MFKKNSEEQAINKCDNGRLEEVDYEWGPKPKKD